jgi:hypothetical protein
MGKRSRPNCDKNGCKCKKQRKAVTLEEKLSVIQFSVFVLRDDFSERINRVIRGFAVFSFGYFPGVRLALWRRSLFLNFCTPCILNVNNAGTKRGKIMK